MCDASLTLVQTTPVGSFDVPPVVASEPTWRALTGLADRAQRSLDLTAMYVDLLGTEAHEHFNASRMESFGAARGLAVFDALKAAAARGVAVRLLLGTLDDPLNSTEVKTLLAYKSVSARTWDPKPWYGGGIMHAKLWVSDRAAAYLGSANADWKSLAQVKELGVLMRGGRLVADVASLFEVFWRWAAPNFADRATAVVYSPTLLAPLTVPAWDPIVPAPERAPSPFVRAAALRAPSAPPPPPAACGAATAFVSASPGGALVPPRAADLATLVDTIRGARRTLSLSVMDFLPASAYAGGHGDAPLYWPALTDAILAVAYARNVSVRLLVSRWAHTSAQQGAAMRTLGAGLGACAGAYLACRGSLVVRQYEVPGWNATWSAAEPTAAWPSYTRVNHAKYIVTEQRVNIGTSNWQWGYFYQTAGASLNTDDPALVRAAQEVFDRDWASAYAVPLDQ